MIKDEIKKYILSKPEFQVPFVQNKFSVSYPEMKEVLDELIKDCKIEFVSGMTYRVFNRTTQVYKPADNREALYIKILWDCIKRGRAYTVTVQRRFSLGYTAAARAIDWMEDNGYVSPYPKREVLISRETFIETFGKVEDEDLSETSDYGKKLSMAERQCRREWGVVDHEDYDEDEEDDDDDLSDIFQLLDGDGEKEENSNEEDVQYDFRSALVEAFDSGLKNNGPDRFTIRLSDGAQFELKFIADGNALRISDGGKTYAESGQSRRKVTNVLGGFAPVVLDKDGEISVTVETPSATLMSLLTLYAAVSAVKKIK